MYNREYLETKNTTKVENKEEERSQSFEVYRFLSDTYKLFGASLIAAGAGAYIGITVLGAEFFTMMTYILLVVAEIGLLIALNFYSHKHGINSALLFGFTFLSGLTLTPILSTALGMATGASIIMQALIMTGGIFAGMSYYALTTKKDLSFMGKFLMAALIGVVIGSIANIFIGSSLLQLGIAWVGAVLFSIFIAYDTQAIIKGQYANPMLAAVSLYLNFVNLFVSLLQILMSFNRED